MLLQKDTTIRNQLNRNRQKWRQILMLCLIMLAILLSITGCSGKKTAVQVQSGEQFTIGIGESAKIVDQDLKITFVEVIGDSRCPRDAVCIWSGVVSFQVNITYRDIEYPLALKQPGLSDLAEDLFFNHELFFRIDPYPSASEPIDPKDYQLTMTVGP